MVTIHATNARMYAGTGDNWIWSNAVGTTASVNITYDPVYTQQTWGTTTNTINITYSGFINAADVWRDLHWSEYGETEEQRTARIEAARLAREQEALEAAEYAERAQLLLLSHLDEDEIERWLQYHELEVISQSGKRYLIDGSKTAHNIFELDEAGTKIKEFCVYGPGVPLADNALTQMLCLRYSEAHLLSRANAWDIHSGETVYRHVDLQALDAAAAFDEQRRLDGLGDNGIVLDVLDAAA